MKDRNLFRNFLESINNYLKENLSTLKCKDVYDIYFQLSYDLKHFKGNSHGFNGFSEFLIFRFLFNQLGGLFKKEELTKDIYHFHYKNIKIGQSIPVTIGMDNKGKLIKKYPDIVVYKSDKQIAIIQIKIYLTRGIKEIDNEMRTLITLKQQHQEIRALLLIYALSKKGTLFDELQKRKEKNDWFDFVILKDNDELLKDRLDNSLDLYRARV